MELSYDQLYEFFSRLKGDASWDQRWDETSSYRPRPTDLASRRYRARAFVALTDELRARAGRRALRDLVTQEGVVLIERYVLAEEELYLADYELSEGLTTAAEQLEKTRTLVEPLDLFDYQLYEGNPGRG